MKLSATQEKVLCQIAEGRRFLLDRPRSGTRRTVRSLSLAGLVEGDPIFGGIRLTEAGKAAAAVCGKR